MIDVSKEYLKLILLSAVDHTMGGEECYNFMPFSFKILTNIFKIMLYLIILKYFSGDFFSKKCDKDICPKKLEKYFGYISIITMLLLIYYKIKAKILIFILCPCHVLLTLQIVLLLSPSNSFNKKLYLIAMNLLFSPWAAILFPDLNGLEKIDILLFWIEHYLIGIINPIILSLSDRYYVEDILCFKNHLISHCFFGYYNRIVLSIISHLSWANLNYNLCASTGDPFSRIFGNYYYFFADYYVFILSEIANIFLKLFINFSRKINSNFNKKLYHNELKTEEIPKKLE